MGGKKRNRGPKVGRKVENDEDEPSVRVSTNGTRSGSRTRWSPQVEEEDRTERGRGPLPPLEKRPNVTTLTVTETSLPLSIFNISF